MGKYTFLLICISGLLLAGCDENDMESLVPVTEGSLCFSVRVNDGGYTPTGIHTRATDNSDYTTTFTPGDRIGVFAVKDGSIDNRVNNLCLTATSSGGGGSSLTWQDADGKAPLYVAGATYYAYYPYQETLTGDLAPNPTIPGGAAPDAAGFFAGVVSAWTPSTAQGTYAEYTAQDLMIACGTLSDKSLTFSMTHQMALVVIDLPRTRYSFSNTSPTIPDYSIDAPDTKFTGFSPCRMDAGTYRYLLNPSVSSSSPTTLSGSYTNAQGQTSEWSFTASAGTGTYNVYQVDNAAVKEIKDYELQAGDFYMKDGSLLAKTTDLTDTQKTACIGIIYCVSNSFITGNSTNKTTGGYTHALVVALKDASTSSSWPNAGSAVSDYQKAVAAPSGSSNWYLPNIDELRYICRGSDYTSGPVGPTPAISGKTALNTQFQKLNSESVNSFGNDIYWSSTYYGISDVGSFELYHAVDFNAGSSLDGDKNNSLRVRCSLAF